MSFHIGTVLNYLGQTMSLLIVVLMLNTKMLVLDICKAV